MWFYNLLDLQPWPDGRPPIQTCLIPPGNQWWHQLAINENHWQSIFHMGKLHKNVILGDFYDKRRHWQWWDLNTWPWTSLNYYLSRVRTRYIESLFDPFSSPWMSTTFVRKMVIDGDLKDNFNFEIWKNELLIEVYFHYWPIFSR